MSLLAYRRVGGWAREVGGWYWHLVKRVTGKMLLCWWCCCVEDAVSFQRCFFDDAVTSKMVLRWSCCYVGDVVCKMLLCGTCRHVEDVVALKLLLCRRCCSSDKCLQNGLVDVKKKNRRVHFVPGAPMNLNMLWTRNSPSFYWNRLK